MLPKFKLHPSRYCKTDSLTLFSADSTEEAMYCLFWETRRQNSAVFFPHWQEDLEILWKPRAEVGLTLMVSFDLLGSSWRFLGESSFALQKGASKDAPEACYLGNAEMLAEAVLFLQLQNFPEACTILALPERRQKEIKPTPDLQSPTACFMQDI